jgi:hypothetical protein
MMRRNAIVLALVAGAAFTALTSPVFAAPTAEQQAALRASCRADFKANCKGVPAGGAEALQCLQTNVSKLSPDCQAAVNAVTE